MRIIHNIPFTPSERENFRRLVFQNVVHGMRLLLDAMEEWGTQFDHPDYAVSSIVVFKAAGDISDLCRLCVSHQEYLRLFVSLPEVSEGEPFPSSYYEPLKLLWQDAGVQAAQKRAHEIALPEK